MIKKLIFSLVIILSLTTHHAMCMDNEDDKLDAPTISARLAALDEERKKESEYNAKLVMRDGYSRVFIEDARIAEYLTRMEQHLSLEEHESLMKALSQSDGRLNEIYTQKQKLEALLQKAEEKAPTP